MKCFFSSYVLGSKPSKCKVCLRNLRNLRNALLFEFGICCTGSIVDHLCIIDIRVSDEANEKLKMSILEVS